MTNTALKILIIEKGRRQVEVSHRLKKDPAWLSRVVNGWVSPTDDELRRLAAVLGVEVNALAAQDGAARSSTSRRRSSLP